MNLKFEVKPTSITGQSLLVLPDPGYHTPQLSLQMRTDLAKRLAHAANVLPRLVVAARAHTVSRNDASRHALEAALLAAEEVKS